MRIARRPSRRRFLQSAAVATTALTFPTIVPSTVFGQNAPSNRVNLAAIGTGGRGTDNCRHSFLPLKDVRILAAVDCYTSRREAFARMCNDAYAADVCKAYADFRDVLARPDIDGVIISTPDHWHVPLAWYAANAKKDLYVEKPLGVAMSWSWKLREIVQRNNLVFQYGTQQRGDQPQFRRACELVRNGYIGEIERVDAWCPDMSSQFGSSSKPPYGSAGTAAVPAGLDYELWIGPAPLKPYSVDRCTCFAAYHVYDYALGFIAGWAVHPLDIAQWGLNTDHTSPVKYEGAGQLPPKEGLWDTIESWDVRCTYANGVELRHMGHRAAEPVVRKYHPVWRDHGTTFHGTNGWISVDRSAMYASDRSLQTVQVKDIEQRLYTTPSHARNFVDCMRTRAKTISPLDAAIRCDTISHLSDICIRLNRPITWDPAREQILKDAEATAMLDRPIRSPWRLG